MWNFKTIEEAEYTIKGICQEFELLEKGEEIVRKYLVGVENASLETIADGFIKEAKDLYERVIRDKTVSEEARLEVFPQIESYIRIATKIKMKKAFDKEKEELIKLSPLSIRRYKAYSSTYDDYKKNALDEAIIL